SAADRMLFASTITLTAGTGINANLGAAGHPLRMGQSTSSSGAETLKLTATAGGDVFLMGVNSQTLHSVNVNLMGASSAGGINGFSLTMPLTQATAAGDITITSGASITAVGGPQA